MDRLQQRAIDFGEIVREILKQFQHLHDAAAGGQGNLGLQDLKVLEALGENGPQMMRVLAEHLGLAVNSMTSVIDQLEAKQLVVRVRSEVDRRVVNVGLTPEGRKIFDLFSAGRLHFHRALLSALTEDEQEILLVLFRKIAREGWKQVQSLSQHDVA
ncbi:MAG: MarR family transcriptional regulator [Pirellula sp.]|jgi:DNA-binding MarR family transcriptional regulator|nr:MarR family transcriptional regulator [Pirellula sp.]